MKCCQIFFLGLLLFGVHVQANSPVPLAPAVDEDFSDLQAFGEAVGDKRIVLLDELTHGEHENFALKARLVRYLHQHKGFGALVLESGLYDVAQIWQQPEKSIRSQAPGNIFYMYANSELVNGLFDYIDAQRKSNNPLELAGFDGRLSGEYSLAGVGPLIKASAERFVPHVSQGVEWDAYLAQTQQVLARNPGEAAEGERLQYLHTSYRLMSALSQVESQREGYERPDFAARLIHGLAIVAQNIWEMRRQDENDIAMADNVQWLLDNQLKGEKIIVWGHYVHLNYGGTVPHRYDNLGSLLRRRHGDDMYQAHIAASKGRYRNFVDMQVKAIEPRPLAYVEQAVARQQAQPSEHAVFLDRTALNKLVAEKPKGTVFYGIQYADVIPGPEWSQYWDGMFVVSESSPSTASPRSEQVDSE
ncbi:erythromycin esterase family protein [Microbulbifer aggregans]|uniref:erythromycin esterase family protein n=1 Tax=Microbulbifer aggregans TaxID=1769779 RepID=UPI001CFCF3B7|nr:erythromycin esterase family protein [Microbulbifer aggregans]